ncbi:MAG: RNA-guided pseudouridylation complex pseudouridine synthase subunit Cbf5, partial [Candidatus Micrarchaeota archaeon]|nr:RNA-guided pseudouridylation complex pseudouridine synthase subunit Cbf5 [Candidatus Micrarchaeota archaeon]
MDVEALLNNSVAIIDKPRGPTSHEVSSWVKKLAGVSRTGHAGTLDPNVSGVLPVALGRATKLLRYI